MTKHRWSRAAFVWYMLLMVWLLYGQRLGYAREDCFAEYCSNNVNLRPFRTIGNYWYVALRTSDRQLLRHIIVNLAGNVVMFVPLGFFLPLNLPRLRKFWRSLLWMVLIIGCIECLQLVTMLGSLDVDDLILNLIGAVIGYGIWNVIER